MCVLGWLAGESLDVAQLYLQLQRPGQEMTTGQLRAVVAANRHWPAATGDDLIQHPRHAPAGSRCLLPATTLNMRILRPAPKPTAANTCAMISDN